METNFQQKKRHPFVTFLKYLGMGIAGIAAAAGFGFLFGYFVMLLWNWLMPGLFGLGLITFWQAVGLVVLGRILFGGFPRPPHRNNDKSWGKHKCGPHNHHEDWKKWRYYGQYWKEKGEASFKEYVESKEQPEAEAPKG